MLQRIKYLYKKFICRINPEATRYNIFEAATLIFPRCRTFLAEEDSSYFLQLKTRCFQKGIKKVTSPKPFKVHDIFAFSTAAEYNLTDLKGGLENDHLLNTRIISHGVDVLYAYRFRRLCRPWELFFFRDGIVVIWNANTALSNFILNYVKPYEIGTYKIDRIRRSAQLVDYSYDDKIPDTTFTNEGNIILKNDDFWEKYTISYGLAASVYMEGIENQMTDYTSHLHMLTEEMKLGKERSVGLTTVVRKLSGFISFVRNYCEFYREMLDNPPFTHEKSLVDSQIDKLHDIFTSIKYHYAFNKRIKVIADQLVYCMQLIKLFRERMTAEFILKMELYGVLINVVILFCKFAVSETHVEYLLLPFFLMLVVFNLFFYL